jgi:cyclopropane fatty-acyl-phospholipid synthase-like methyltransferase
MDDSFYRTLDIQDERILEFIPYLLADLWSLGGNPEVVVELAEKHVPLSFESSIIDLGCGKGATIIELARRFPGFYRGIDLIPGFIDEGKKKLAADNLLSRVELKIEDMRETVDNREKFDLVIYGYESDILGTIPVSISKLKRITKPAGFIIFEYVYKTDTEPGVEYPAKEELFAEIEESHTEIVDYTVWDKKYIYDFNESSRLTIKKRADELKTMHPELANLFEQYYKNQLREIEILNKYTDFITFLLRSE